MSKISENIVSKASVTKIIEVVINKFKHILDEEIKDKLKTLKDIDWE